MIKMRLTIDEVRDHNTNSDHDLEHAGDTSTNVFGRALGHICGSHSGNATNTETGNNTTSVDERKTMFGTASHGCEDLAE